tara:strand:+ start:207 stop:1148 length:942 start_codon:yes stop_codon:yes gene_type:complete
MKNNLKKILFITCCENGFYCLKKIQKNFNVTSVITLNPEIANKLNVSGYIDVSKWCKKNKIKIKILNKYQLELKDLKNLDYNLIIINGWSRLINKKIIDSSAFGMIGLHAGHPPIGHGRAPIPWNIILNFQDIEVYSFKATNEPDDGDIIFKQTVEITQHDNARTLYEKIMYAGSILIEKSIDNIENQNILQKQNKKISTFYKKRSPKDSYINFNQKCKDIHNFIRALSSPYPNAFAFLNNIKIEFSEAVPFDRFLFRFQQKNPGEILEIFPSGIIIQTQDYPILIKKFKIKKKTYKFPLPTKIYSWKNKLFK